MRPCSKSELRDKHSLGHAPLQRQTRPLVGDVSCPPQFVPMVLAMLLPPAKTKAVEEVEAEAKAKMDRSHHGPTQQLIQIRSQPPPDGKRSAAASFEPILRPLSFIAKGYEVITSTAWQVSCALLCTPLLLSAVTSNGMVISTRRSPAAWLAHSLQARHCPHTCTPRPPARKASTSPASLPWADPAH